MRDLKVLIIDDHRLMVDGFINCFKQLDYNFTFDSAPDCERGESFIMSQKKYDLAIIDYSLPPSKKFKNGGDLVQLTSIKMPDCKIVVITSHDEAFILYDILKKNRPDGLLVKSDFNATELSASLLCILKGHEYRSKTVLNAIKKISTENDYLDCYNRQIISLLAQGHKTKSLADIMGLSVSTIDKRKVSIKDFFGINKGDDQDIVKEARNRRLI